MAHQNDVAQGEILVAPSLLEPIVGICRRIILTMFKLERAHPESSDVVAWTREAFQDALGQLSILDLESTNNSEASEGLSRQAMEIVLELNSKVTADDGLAGPLAIDMSHTVAALFWPATMFQQSPESIPPNELEQMVNAIIRAIQDALDNLARNDGTPRTAEAVRRGRHILEIIRQMGAQLIGTARMLGRYPWHMFVAWLTASMRMLWASFGRLLSRDALAILFRAILDAVFRGGGGAAGAAYVPALVWIALGILAAYGGYKLGRLIGESTVGDQTVDEHIWDFLFMGSPFFESGRVPEGCPEAFERFLNAWENRRESEAIGASKDRIIHFLQDEIDALKFIIEKPCDEQPSRWSRLRSQRMRLRDELQQD